MLRRARVQLLENRELAQHVEFFKEKARFDGLTKIFNKSTFLELLYDEIKRSRVLDYPLSLLILDIDNFKRINDTFGHLIGDNVLKSLGELLIKTLRRNDIVARFGGEEFVVLVPNGTQEQTVKIGDKLRENIADMRLPNQPSITVSVGCSTWQAQDNIDSFIDRADKALYDAKASGKNCVYSR